MLSKFRWSTYLTQELSSKTSKIKRDSNVRQRRGLRELRKSAWLGKLRSSLAKKRNKRNARLFFKPGKRLKRVR